MPKANRPAVPWDTAWGGREAGLTPLGNLLVYEVRGLWSASFRVRLRELQSVRQMRSPAMKSYAAKPGEVGADWHLVDADGKALGRLAARVATILMGKHKPTYTAHVLTGDFVVIVNAEKVRLTGRKMEQKEYDHYTYYPSGRKVTPIARMMERHPQRVIQLAVRRMLPKSKLGRDMLKRLKVYAGPDHPHRAQQPRALELALK